MAEDWKSQLQAEFQRALAVPRALLNDFISRFHAFAESNMEMALYHQQRGNYSDAVFRYRMVVWKQPRNADAWAGLGACLAMMEDIPEARKALKQALKLRPGHEMATGALALLERPRPGPPPGA